MSEEIETMIQQVANKDFTNAGATFESILGEKLTAAMDQEKIAVADTIFNPDVADDEDV